MKKHILLTLLATMLATGAFAKPVSVERARLVAQHYFPQRQLDVTILDGIYLFTPEQGTGFILVSANDAVRPVLAYSASASFPVDSIPEHVALWIEGYSREIKAFAEAEPSPSVKVLWAAAPKSNGQAVAPLMTTTWNQSPRYNAMCPWSASDSAHAVTGCVATATTQIMKYWNHPAKGYGSHSYNSPMGPLSVTFDTLYQWDSMPDALNGASSPGQIRAVAQLMYHLGVAIEMGYGVHSSGAYTIAYGSYNLPSSERALKEHFRYSPMMHAVWKESYTDSQWDRIMRNEIDHQRPILYSGRDESGGHAFVLDGYDTTGMFHVNWGWGGYYDGYYTIDSLSPGAGGIGGNATYTFNLSNTALVGIMPSPGNDTIALVNAISDDTAMGTVSGNGTFTPYADTTLIMATALPGYRFAGWKSGNNTNPILFIVNGDFSDTALFVPIPLDTVAYCDDNYFTAWHDDYGNTTEWGIRVPPALRSLQNTLSEVQLYVPTPGFYSMILYIGDSICEATRVYYNEHDLTSCNGWTSIPLDNPIPLADNDIAWITFRYISANTFPAAASFYTGTSDGSWYHLPQGWVPYDHYGVYQTWMIRAIFSERPLMVQASSSDPTLGSVSGSGLYDYGTIATLTATPIEPATFERWSDGTTANPYPLHVTSDTTVAAIFTIPQVGISDPAANQIRIAVDGINLSVDSEARLPLELFDASGRLIATLPPSTTHHTSLPSAGIYIVRLGNHSYKIVAR